MTLCESLLKILFTSIYEFFFLSFRAFVIFNCNYDEHLTWIKFREDLIS